MAAGAAGATPVELTIPSALRSLAAAGSAVAELARWRRRARGDARALVGELTDNLLYLDMVADEGVPLADVVDRLSIAEYRRLSKEGFDFDSLKRGRIEIDPSMKGTELAPWAGKRTGELVESIYDKINEIKIRYPHVGGSGRYRWNVRVNNIRKRVWLLLRHVRG